MVSGILFLTACLYLALNNSFISKFIPEPEKRYSIIGYIHSVHGDTRVRSAGELLWVPGKSREPIYDHDSIFTGEDGDMRIEMEPSTTLKINKDSLLNVSRREYLTSIQILQGEVTSSSAKGDTIRIQKDNKSQLIKLTGVENKSSYDAFTKDSAPGSYLANSPAPDNFATALTDEAEKREMNTHHPASAEFQSAPNEPRTTEAYFEKINAEETKSVLTFLAIGYALFSFIALREVLKLRKES
jgi:hypothetical protein